MSVELQSNETSPSTNFAQHIQYHFKTTEENRTKTFTVTMNAMTREHIVDRVLESPQWRSFSQFLNDAIIYYLNGSNDSPEYDEVMEKAQWNSNHVMTAAITPTLFEEIDMMVNHVHTPWETKQELYICALFAYDQANTPTVIRR